LGVGEVVNCVHLANVLFASAGRVFSSGANAEKPMTSLRYVFGGGGNSIALFFFEESRRQAARPKESTKNAL